MTIWFDMDGTIADLYGVNGWLNYLLSEDVTPYAIAKPLLRLATLAHALNTLQKKGYKIGIISWLAKNSTSEYDTKVANAKREWLNTHLKSVKFDAINIVTYGTPKETFAKSDLDILFDDEKQNRDRWTGKAYDVDNILSILRELH